MQLVKKIVTLFLLVVFFLETTPHDLLHLVTGHIDNHDNDYAETLISPQHIHCAALQLTIPEFNKSEVNVSLSSQSVFSYFCHPLYPGIASKYEAVVSLRGPPAC